MNGLTFRKVCSTLKSFRDREHFIFIFLTGLNWFGKMNKSAMWMNQTIYAKRNIPVIFYLSIKKIVN